MRKVLNLVFVALILFSCSKDEPKSSEKKMIECLINSVKGTIDEKGKTVLFEFPSGTDITALTPVIKVSDKAKVSPASGVVKDFSKPVAYTITAEDESTAVYTVTVNVTKNNEAKITSFSFSTLDPVVYGNIDEANKTVKLSLPARTDLTKLVPAIEYSNGATISPKADVAQNFTNPVIYTVTSEKGEEVKYTVQAVIDLSSKQINSFVFSSLSPVVSATIDEVAKTISATVPYGTDVTALSPVIGISAGATISPKSETVQDFTRPVKYTVTASNKSTAVYTATITVAPFETSITGLSSLQVKAGGELTITGVFTPTGNTVIIGKTVVFQSDIISQNATSILLRIPLDIQEGSYDISVNSGGVTAIHTEKVQVSLPDLEITNVTPLSVLAGGTITITGKQFEVSGNIVSFAGTDYTLTIASESTTSITATLPTSVTAGEYILKVVSGTRSNTYTTKITVITDPNTPLLTSLNKTDITKWADDLVINGVNLGESGSICFRRKGVTFYKYIDCSPNNGTITIKANQLEKEPEGEYDIWWEVNDKETNKLSFTLLKNPNPIPVITSVSDLYPCIGTNVVIKGSDFGEDAVLRLKLADFTSFYDYPNIVSQSATEIVFKTDYIDHYRGYTTIEVISRGQTGVHKAAFQAKQCTPEFVSVSPGKAARGVEVTITGKHFTGHTFLVKIGDRDAIGTAKSDTEVTFVVPFLSAMQTTLTVRIGHNGTELYSTPFEVLAKE